MEWLFALEFLGFLDFLVDFFVKYFLMLLLIFDDEIGLGMRVLLGGDIVLIELFVDLFLFFVDDFIRFSYVLGTDRHTDSHFLLNIL